MEYKRNRTEPIPFSLHDSHIQKMTVSDNALILKVNKVFQYTDTEQRIYTGDIIFTKTDLEDCSMFIFDADVYRGDFQGKVIDLKEYLEHYPLAEFEILTESYHGYNSIYIGLLRQEGKKTVSAILTLWNMGEMIYHLNFERSVPYHSAKKETH